MKLTANLVFWDEPAKDLYAWAKSIGQLADRIVAADGPFALYPHDDVHSSDVALAALRDGAADSGTELHLLEGREWEGQVAKRDAVIKASEPTDWVFWSDADERIVTCDKPAVLEALASNDSVDSYCIYRTTPANPEARWEPDSFPGEREGQTTILPRMYRYLDHMAVVKQHWCYIGFKGDKGISYWGPVETYLPAKQADIPIDVLHFEHLQTWRSDEYRERQLDYRSATADQVSRQGVES